MKDTKPNYRQRMIDHHGVDERIVAKYVCGKKYIAFLETKTRKLDSFGKLKSKVEQDNDGTKPITVKLLDSKRELYKDVHGITYDQLLEIVAGRLRGRLHTTDWSFTIYSPYTGEILAEVS